MKEDEVIFWIFWENRSTQDRLNFLWMVMGERRDKRKRSAYFLILVDHKICILPFYGLIQFTAFVIYRWGEALQVVTFIAIFCAI